MMAIIPLGFTDRRVLGTIAEKALTYQSGDSYPLTINSMVSGCNQKSNRDPITDLGADEVEDSVERLMEAKLVERVPLSSSSRTERYKHVLYNAWSVSKIDLAILAELLLRGLQTEGELRGRAGRMADIPDLEVLRNHLKDLARREMVIYLTPENKRGAILTHGYYEPDELPDERRKANSGTVAESPGPRSSSGAGVAELASRIEHLEKAVEELKQQIAMLQSGRTPPT